MLFKPKRSQRAPGLYFYELALSAGPRTLAAPGSGSYGELFGSDWLLEGRDDGLRFYQFVGGAWQEASENLPTVAALTGAERHYSLAFNQTARVIFCFERGGVVKVTRWDPPTNSYLQNVSFAGVDPVLLMDATITKSLAESDVVLFYLSPDRTKVRYRLQRDTFGVENDLYTFSAPVVLDRALALLYRYELLVSDFAGKPLEQNGVTQALRSGLYPIYLPMQPLRGEGRFTEGRYRETAFIRAHSFGLRGSGKFTGGVYFMPVVLYGAAPYRLVGQGRFSSGVYKSIVTTYKPKSFAVRGSGKFSSGLYKNVVKGTANREIRVRGSGRFTGGSYAAA